MSGFTALPPVPGPEDIILGASEIALELSKIATILHDELVMEQKFTQQTVDRLRKKYPSVNVVVVHPSFRQTFDPTVTHAHFELPLHGTRTQGYEIFTFKSGEFWLDGDGGFQNWCFDGKYVRDDHHVTFSDPAPPHVPGPPPPPPPPAVPITVPLPAAITDGVYLINSYKGDQQSSGLAWYRQALNADGKQPDAYIDIAQGPYYWEGVVSNGTFADKNAFTAFVLADGHTKPQDGFAGIATNNFREFNVYKDNFRVLYTIDGWQCHTVYRCL